MRPVSMAKKKKTIFISYWRMELIQIPAGEFLMGSDKRIDIDAHGSEQPQHQLYLPEYYIGKTPVANAQYAVFVKAAKHSPPSHWEGGKIPKEKQNHPVVNVTWHDAVDFCIWLSEKSGQDIQLPSESEWEKAASWAVEWGAGGKKWIYPWGNEWDKTRCNTTESGTIDTTPVGKYSPQGDSPYGCVDMAGNVWEWTRSLWGEDYSEPEFKYPYDPGDGRENLEASDDVDRVLCGGSWGSHYHK